MHLLGLSRQLDWDAQLSVSQLRTPPKLYFKKLHSNLFCSTDVFIYFNLHENAQSHKNGPKRKLNYNQLTTLRTESPSIFVDKSGRGRTYLAKMETTLLAGYQLTFVVSSKLLIQNNWLNIFFGCQTFCVDNRKSRLTSVKCKESCDLFFNCKNYLQNFKDLKCLSFLCSLFSGPQTRIICRKTTKEQLMQTPSC